MSDELVISLKVFIKKVKITNLMFKVNFLSKSNFFLVLRVYIFIDIIYIYIFKMYEISFYIITFIHLCCCVWINNKNIFIFLKFMLLLNTNLQEQFNFVLEQVPAKCDNNKSCTLCLITEKTVSINNICHIYSVQKSWFSTAALLYLGSCQRSWICYV